VAVALLSVGLYKLGLKKKLVRFVVNIPVVVLSAAGFIMLLANPKRLFGYVSLDEAVCDRVETVGTIAALVMATDMIVIGIMTAQCLDLSGKVSQTRLLGIASGLVFVSIMAVLAGYFVTEMSVYIALLVINVLGIAALLLFTGARKK
jgi:hypothetical protein